MHMYNGIIIFNCLQSVGYDFYGCMYDYNQDLQIKNYCESFQEAVIKTYYNFNSKSSHLNKAARVKLFKH